MPRRELLTSTDRLQLLAFPEDEGELIRLFTFTKSDLAFVRQHRGDHNRLGIAVLLSYLRHPGRVLAQGEKPYEPVLSLVAEQLRIPASAWDLYAERDETRREHLLELFSLLRMEPFSTRHYRALSEWLGPMALQTSRGIFLAQAVVEELRKRLIILPPVAVIERLCSEAATRAQRKIFGLLTQDLSAEQKSQLDALLEMREGSPYSTLAWMRLPPGPPTSRAILAHIERLQAIRALHFSPEISRRVHQNRLLQITREAAQTAVYQLKEYEPDRRYGTLVTLMIESAATLTDEILDLHDRLIGSFFTKSKNKYERAFAEQGKAINEKVRLYAKVGAALVAAREQGRDPYAAIEEIVSWDAFSRSVNEAQQLARDEDFDALSLITEHYSQLRRFAPILLETFEFRPAPVARDLIDAVDILRMMNREGMRKVPENAPMGFIRKKWANYVFTPEGIDRRFYELCVMAELKNALRSGDVSVPGSRQFQEFEDYLIPRSEFDLKIAQNGLHVSVPTSPTVYLEKRMSLLKQALDETNALAGAGQLPGVELSTAGLKISPIENSVPKEADSLKQTLYGMLPKSPTSLWK